MFLSPDAWLTEFSQPRFWLGYVCPYGWFMVLNRKNNDDELENLVCHLFSLPIIIVL